MGDSDLMMVGWLDTNLAVRLLRLYRISRYRCVHLFIVCCVVMEVVVGLVSHDLGGRRTSLRRNLGVKMRSDLD